MNNSIRSAVAEYLSAIKLDRLGVGWPFGEVSRGEKMAPRGTDPVSYVTEFTSVYEDDT